jgi:hypothetical protein
MAPRSDATSGPPGGVPELELDVRTSSTPKAKPRTEPALEVSLELAVDPNDLVRERSPGSSSGADLRPRGPIVMSEISPPQQQAAIASVGDVAFDARLLADYGDPPRHWPLSPLYAWKVLKRRRELKMALTGRREEATRASNEAEDALVALAERVRPTVEKSAAYAHSLDELRHAEELLRSRDQVLATEQDAQNARLSQVDARLSTMEAELALAMGEERAIATELSAVQSALAREDARLKRAEIELRAAQLRDTRGGDDE